MNKAESLPSIRFQPEIIYADALAATPIFQRFAGDCSDTPTADRVRRKLLAGHVRLSENMAPDVFTHARHATEALRMTTPVEIYQAAGEGNAANWTCAEVCFVALQGNMISLLDRESFIALLGHEFGHHLAHTVNDGKRDRLSALRCSTGMAYDANLEPGLRVLASRVAMGKEFTADRYAAVAAGGLDGPLRLMMTVVTGLPAERLKADSECYLAQARALFDTHGSAETSPIGSHPEHLLRAYALSLFVESDVFQQITGQGPGTRKLSEVDEALHRILTASSEHFFEPEPDEPMPPEMQEFSLCAAVLMADCDGDLDEAEAKAIEETFAEAVPVWKELLHPERALERFSELLPLAISSGERAAASVFHVLVHIMLADREVHVRELELISAIGRSLRQGAMFDYLLGVVARSIRVERTEAVVERPLPALPPGQHEAEAALKGLLAGMSRRGGGSVTLARLLRIVGKTAWDDEVRSLTLQTAKAHHLEPASEPTTTEDGTMRLDQPLLFRLTEKEAHRRDQAAHEAETNALAQAKTRDALLTALKHLRERLVSGDGRSPSVRLYRTSSGKHFDLAQLDRVITGRSERVVAMLHDATTIPMLSGAEAGLSKTSSEVSSAIRQLEREFKARVEETGSRDLYVGYPFLIGVVGGFFVRAPLVLHPFSIVGDGKGSGSFTLKKREDDEAIANQALIRLLFAKKGYAFTDELADTLDAKAAEGTQELLTALKDIGLDAAPLSGAITPFENMNAAAAILLPEGFSISENAVAGFFPQSSSDLLQDYDELLAKLEPDSAASLEQSLNAACDVLPAHYRPAFTAAADADAPDQPVIYADPSQRAAVQRSRGTRLLVMDGPPGTGKSQTIVNLVADELARGGRVGIVCEKRVALDVVKQRMDAAGIGHLAAVVHDVHDDRKALYLNIVGRLEQAERRAFDPQKLAELRGEADTLECQITARSRKLAAPTACGLTLGQLHSMAASFDVEPVHVAGMESVPHAELPRLSQALRETHPHSRLFAAGSPFRTAPGHEPRASFADMSSAQIQEVAAVLRQAQKAAAHYEQLYTATPLPWESLESAEKALRLAISCAAETEADALGHMLVLRSGPNDAASSMEDAFADLERHRGAAESVQNRVEMQTSHELTAALSTASLKVGSFFKFLMPSWRSACAVIRETLVREWPEKAGCKIDAALLAQLTQRFKAAQTWLAAGKIYKSLGIASQLPRDAATLFEQNKALIHAWQSSGQLAREKPALESVSLWPLPEGQTLPANGWKAWSSRCQAALDLLAAQKTYAEALEKTTPHFPQSRELGSAGLAVLTDRFIVEEASLRAADRLLGSIASHIPSAHLLVETLADVLPDASATLWSESVLRGWAESCLAAAEAGDSSLRLLDQPPPMGSMEKASSRLIELHQAIAQEESLRLAASGDARGLMSVPSAEARARRTPEQTVRETLIRECRKQRNVTPMRTLIRRHAKEGLLDVLPVWLMSPETTAILFPREPVFDLLIIDEASQCTVENGLPVLTRARRAVIAGDDKQMPPTSFFKASSGIEADQDEADESEVPVDAFESESLLVLARHSGTGAPLRWHYRALYEELIAFSNHSMYGGSLLTIPATLSRSAPPAVRWVRLEDGKWDAGNNLPEAKHVVTVLGDLLARPKPPSVGIVTFNLQQRKAILDEIDSRRAEDSAFAEVYDKAASHESLDQRPFVKNLESVQGDERDAIIFSLGYAPVKRVRKDGMEEIYVPARFGPLGQKGGERRLNVAVSRAKHEVIVVSSFDPAMLSVAHTKNDGPRMFKAFVEFARHLGEGRRNQAEKILSLVNDASQRRVFISKHAAESVQTLPLHHQISLALEAIGLKVETLVGTSEFRLPVAIVHTDDAHRYALAILCDDGSALGDTYEDHVHVPNVLKHRGWRHLRVHSREWHRERDRVIERIREALAA